MAFEFTTESPLAEALNTAIRPKLVEVGWSTSGADDSALAEYIILMLVNGKSQEQIASELSGDLLNLGPDDPGARNFAQWLFQEVEAQARVLGGTGGPVAGLPTSSDAQNDTAAPGQDAEMRDAADPVDANIPKGPKSMRNGAPHGRDKRMFGQLSKQMDRNADSVLHRVRPQGGSERINSHARGPPTGPRGQQGRMMNAGGRAQNNRLGAGLQNQSMMGGGIQNSRMGRGFPGSQNQLRDGLDTTTLNPQQQMELLAVFEQQSRMMAQLFDPQYLQQNGNMGLMDAQQQNGRPLADRVQQPHRINGGFRKGHQQNNNRRVPEMVIESLPGADVEMASGTGESSSDAVCRFNLNCTNKECKFAHQSPATLPGTPIAIDLADNCSFSAACKNRKCTGRHPSPAQKRAHQEEQICKFWPKCTNGDACPFKHMPFCTNGPDCTTSNCQFTHVREVCKYNPCLNKKCAYKHEDGQQRGKFEDKVWTADSTKNHVSERKFVDDEGATEELIVPGSSSAAIVEASNTPASELVT